MKIVKDNGETVSDFELVEGEIYTLTSGGEGIGVCSGCSNLLNVEKGIEVEYLGRDDTNFHFRYTAPFRCMVCGGEAELFRVLVKSAELTDENYLV